MRRFAEQILRTVCRLTLCHAPLVDSRPLLLLVEDHDDLRDSTADLLELSGYDVRAARDGEEALALLRSMPVPPRAVLLDLCMPKMDGETFAGCLARDPSLGNIPIVVWTAELLVGRLPGNVVATLRKPVAPDVLVQMLDGARARAADTAGDGP